jgi:hypothetical protein
MGMMSQNRSGHGSFVSRSPVRLEHLRDDLHLQRVSMLLSLASLAGPAFPTNTPDESPEVFHQHQVVHRRIHPGIEYRMTLLRCSEAQEHVTEITCDCRGPVGREIEILKPCLS